MKLERAKWIGMFWVIVFFFAKGGAAYGSQYAGEQGYGILLPVSGYLPQKAVLTLEDVYAINEQYQQNPDLDIQEGKEILEEMVQNRVHIEYTESYWIADGECLVPGDEGDIEYVCTIKAPYSGSGLMSKQIMLVSLYTGEIIGLNETKERLDRFVVRHTNYAKTVKEQYRYAKSNLNDKQCRRLYVEYGVNRKAGVCAELIDEGKREVLEKKGVKCMITEDLSKEVQETEENVEKEGIEKVFWDEVQVCIEQMKQRYPEYTDENLLTLICLNRDYRSYMNSEKELETFVSGIKYYSNIKNSMDEKRYGDPKQIALTILLKKYKDIYQEAGYRELYEKYAQKITENRTLTQEEKRSRYQWKIIQAEQIAQKIQKTKKEEMEEKGVHIARIGCVVLAVGCVVMSIAKKN